MSSHTGEQSRLNVESKGVLNAIIGSVGILTLSGILTYKGVEAGSIMETVPGSILDLGGLAVAAHIPLRLRGSKS